MSALFYKRYQLISDIPQVADNEKDKHFKLSLDICMTAKELGHKNAIRTWNEYMLYGQGRTTTLIFY